MLKGSLLGEYTVYPLSKGYTVIIDILDTKATEDLKYLL